MVVAADDGVMPQTREHATVLARAGRVGRRRRDHQDPTSPHPARATSRGGRAAAGRGDRARLVAHRRRPRRAARGAGTRRGPRGAARRRRPAAPARRPRVQRQRRRARWSRARCGRARPRAATTCDPARRAGGRASAAWRSTTSRVERAAAGQRVALNLVGVDRDEVARGDVITRRRRAAARRRTASDVALDVGYARPRPDGGARVGVHHGTRESAARLVELGGRFFQLRLEQPIVPAAGDRLVIRSLAPPDTLGGGVVLDPQPRRHGPSRDLLARLTPPRTRRARTRGPRRTRRRAGARARAALRTRRSRSRPRCAPRATSRRSTTRPTCSPSSASTAAPSGSARRCTSTPTRSRTSRTA